MNDTWAYLAAFHLPSSPRSIFSRCQCFWLALWWGCSSPKRLHCPSQLHGGRRGQGGSPSQPPLPSDTAALPTGPPGRCPALWLPQRLLLPLLPPEAESLPLSPCPPSRGLFTRTLASSSCSVLSLQPCLPVSLGSQPAIAFSMLRDRCMRKRKKTTVIGRLRTSWAERWVRVTEKQVLQLVDRRVRPPGGGDFSPHCHNVLPVL